MNSGSKRLAFSVKISPDAFPDFVRLLLDFVDQSFIQSSETVGRADHYRQSVHGHWIEIMSRSNNEPGKKGTILYQCMPA
jgi:hypothetical protein